MKCEQSTKELARMLWAKAAPSYKSLWNYIVDSIVCAATLASDLRFRSATMLLADLLDLTEEETIRFVAYDAAIHDCYGKAHPAFQKKSPEDAMTFFEANLISKERDCEDSYRHERYGEKCFKERDAKVTSIPIEMINIIGSTIGLHHQGKHGHCKSPKVQKEQWSITSCTEWISSCFVRHWKSEADVSIAMHASCCYLHLLFWRTGLLRRILLH